LAIIVPYCAMSSSTPLQSKSRFNPDSKWCILHEHPHLYCSSFQQGSAFKPNELNQMAWSGLQDVPTTSPPDCVAITVLPHILNNPLAAHRQFLFNGLNAHLHSGYRYMQGSELRSLHSPYTVTCLWNYINSTTENLPAYRTVLGRVDSFHLICTIPIHNHT
jgi:hypothetical protein